MTAVKTQRVEAPVRRGGFDPMRTSWELLTNVKFALFLVGLAGVAGLIGTVVPQVPAPMRENAAARSAWIELRREDFGTFTDAMDRLQLFDVFHSAWFNGLWVLIIVAVTVCTVSRFRPTWRGVHRPPKVVADAYFDHAHHRASFSHPGGAEAVEADLRKRRYRVERVKEDGGSTWLFAQRYQWSAYGTFLSHLALLMLLIGGMLTVFAGFDRTLVIAEEMPAAAVFDDPGPGQLFVAVKDSVRGVDEQGNIIDYRSHLEVRRGDETIACTTTVNDPCSAFGYKVHQAAWFNDIARLRIVDASGGVAFDGVLDFENRTTIVPVLRVTDLAGAVLLEQPIPQLATETGTRPGPEDDFAIGSFTVAKPASPGGPAQPVEYALAWRVVGERLELVVSGGGIPPTDMATGDGLMGDGLFITYLRAAEMPARRVDDMPGAATDDGSVVVQMPTGADGKPYLVITGVNEGNLFVPVGESRSGSSGYSYEFTRQLEASGVSVRRDPGDTFIWLAVGMAMVGLSITFYVPRRRLWVKVTPERTHFAGVAERTTRLGRELRLMGASLGSKDALLPGDVTPD